MDLTLVAILYTGLFALGFQAMLNSGVSGPAGRRQGLPRYQRRILVSFTVIVLSVVIDAYLLARDGGAPRPALGGLSSLDVLALLGLLVSWASLRRDADRGVVRWIGLGLGAYGLGVTFVWTALAFAGASDAGSAFIATLGQAWGTSTAAVGFIALFHYLLTPALFAAAVTAHDAWPRLDDWDKDRALQPLALISTLLALGYALFTASVLLD